MPENTYRELERQCDNFAEVLYEVYRTNSLPEDLQSRVEETLLQSGVLETTPQVYKGNIRLVCPCGSSRIAVEESLVPSANGMDDEVVCSLECEDCHFTTLACRDFSEALEVWIKEIRGRVLIAAEDVSPSSLHLKCSCGAHNVRVNTETFSASDAGLKRIFDWQISCGSCGKMVRGRIRVSRDRDITDAIAVWLDNGGRIDVRPSPCFRYTNRQNCSN